MLPRAQAFSPARHPELTSTQLVANPDVDLHRMVLIENDPERRRRAERRSDRRSPAMRIDDLGPNEVRVEATADEPSYLVLDDFYHRGWTARVDGQPTRVLIANALFRAVPIEPEPTWWTSASSRSRTSWVRLCRCCVCWSCSGAIVWSMRAFRVGGKPVGTSRGG